MSLLLALATIQNAPSDAMRTAIAEGDRLLEEADASDLFTNESATGEGAILLRHKASGYRCVLNPGKSVNVVRVYPNATRGDDVSCTTQTIGDARSVYFTRNSGSAEKFAQAGGIAIQSRYRNAREVHIESELSLSIPGTDYPKPISLGYETADSYEQVTVGKQGDWIIKYRFSSPPGSSNRGGHYERSWLLTVMEPAATARRAESVTASPGSTSSSPTTD